MLPSNQSGTPVPNSQIEPQFTDRSAKPKGVIAKNFKTMLYIGAMVLLVVTMLVSNVFKKGKTGPKAKNETPPPVVQDNMENNVAAMHAQFGEEKRQQGQQDQQKQQDAALAGTGTATGPFATPQQRAAAAGYGPNGQPTPGAYPGGAVGQYGGSSQQAPQITPEQQQAQQLAQKERERQYASRFESNLVYSAAAQQGPQARQQPGTEATQGMGQGTGQAPEQGQPTSLIAPRAAGEPPAQQPGYKRALEVNVDAATGQPYVIHEGLTLDTVLMNRIDGDAAGPVRVLVSDPVYSHDRQHVLIPEGTVVLGEARKIGGAGFGQQRRIAVVFHRMIMPDGYSVDLDQFHGLDQIGEEGLKDKVNNHYLEIFGTSVALGVISGAAQITQGGSGYSANGSQSFTNGVTAGVSQQATTVLDKFIQIPPSVTIREGHRVKVYFTQDLLLPAYTNHTIAQTF